MENLNKQQGEKKRKMETKTDSRSHAHQTPIKKEERAETKAEENVEETKTEADKEETKTEAGKEETKTGQKPEEKKKAEQKKVKKELAFIKMSGLPISTKHSIALCRFIKGKTIERALEEMEKVAGGKLAVRMKGEIPHRHGIGMMSGRYPINAAKIFVKVLKSLEGNASVSGINEPVITLASASWGSRPMKRGGMKFKRTYLYIEAREGRGKNINKKDLENKGENKKE